MPSETGSQKNKRYQNVTKGTEELEPYFFDDLLFYVGHADFTTAILKSLEPREDAHKLFSSSVLKSFRFWRILIASNVITLCLSLVLFYLFPRQTTHIVEQVVNSQVPGLFPFKANGPAE
jgi:hypothetical protein